MTHFIHSSASGFSHSIPQQFAILTAATNIAFLFCHLVQHTQNIVSQTVQISLDEICLNHEAQAKIIACGAQTRKATPSAVTLGPIPRDAGSSDTICETLNHHILWQAQ